MSIVNPRKQPRRKSAGKVARAARPSVPHVAPAGYFRWSGVLSRVAGAALLIPGLPLIAVLILLVRCTSRGPGIYRQMRVGRHGRTFWLYKIRTMACDAEAATGPVWTQQGDPRVTRLGHVLRKLHLDELPQLFNVLKGEMALIGPRPERPEFVQVLVREIPRYLDRLAVLPGVTGLAQVNLPPDSELDSVRRKLRLDLQYIQHGSWWLDARIFLCTSVRLLLHMVGVTGDSSMRLFGLNHFAAGLGGESTGATSPWSRLRMTPVLVARQAERRASSKRNRKSRGDARRRARRAR